MINQCVQCTPRCQHGQRLRRGTNIPEMLVATVLTVAVLTSASKLVHQVFFQQQLAVAESDFQLGVSRLARHFRGDVRSAVSARIDDAENVILAMADESEVRYSVSQTDANQLIREQQITSGTKQHRDVLTLPRFAAIQLAIDDSNERPMVQLNVRILDQVNPVDQETNSALLIEAAPNQDAR